MDELVAEAEAAMGGALPPGTVMMVVGHEGRLSNLITLATGKRTRPLGKCEAVCVAATSKAELLVGLGKLVWRLPVRVFDGSELREKLASKITVTGLLAGFDATAIVELIVTRQADARSITGFDPAAIAMLMDMSAIALLAAGTTLFLSAVYVFDAISMPEGFWVASGSSRWKRMPASVRRHLADGYGPAYSFMIFAWIWFFTPGVLLSGAGYLVMIIRHTSPLFGLVIFLMLAAIAGCYRRFRPRLGVD